MSSPKSKRDILKKSQDREKKINRVRLTLGVFFVIFLIGAFVGLLNWKFFRLTQINVVGESAEGKEDVKNFVENKLKGRYFFLIPKDSVFFLSKENISLSTKKNFPCLSEVGISLVSLNSLFVKIKDKEARLICCDSQEANKCFYVNADGEIYSEAPNFSEPVMNKIVAKLPSAPIGQKFLASSTVEKISVLISTAEALILNLPKISNSNRVSYLEPLKAGDWQLFVNQGDGKTWKIIFNENKAISQLVGGLSSSLSNEVFLKDWSRKTGNLDYIDLRFDGKIFYRFR